MKKKLIMKNREKDLLENNQRNDAKLRKAAKEAGKTAAQ